MKQRNKNIAVMDIGNSRIKMYFNNVLITYSYTQNWVNEFADKIVKFKVKPDYFLISSVNNIIKKKVISVLKKENITYISADEILERENIIKYKNIKGIGIDRVIGLIGAAEYVKPPLITVDCGTAVTVNALNENYLCLGGLIFAGPFIQLSSLSERTDNLRIIDLKSKKKILALNTSDALSNGILYGIAGGIKSIIDKIIDQNFNANPAPVIISGGGAKVLINVLKSTGLNFSYKEDITIKGLIRITDFI